MYLFKRSQVPVINFNWQEWTFTWNWLYENDESRDCLDSPSAEILSSIELNDGGSLQDMAVAKIESAKILRRIYLLELGYRPKLWQPNIFW